MMVALAGENVSLGSRAAVTTMPQARPESPQLRMYRAASRPLRLRATTVRLQRSEIRPEILWLNARIGHRDAGLQLL
jgi:hypothetical protein